MCHKHKSSYIQVSSQVQLEKRKENTHSHHECTKFTYPGFIVSYIENCALDPNPNFMEQTMLSPAVQQPDWDRDKKITFFPKLPAS